MPIQPPKPFFDAFGADDLLLDFQCVSRVAELEDEIC